MNGYGVLTYRWKTCPETEKKKESNAKRKAYLTGVDTTNINIRHRCTEPYVMRGSYHILANDLRVLACRFY